MEMFRCKSDSFIPSDEEEPVPWDPREPHLDRLAEWRAAHAPNKPTTYRRVLVTGGAGFIGSHLVDRLMKEGHDVIVVDNLFTGKKENILRWFGHPRFEFIRHDVTEPIQLEVDEIYHLACPASPVHYKYNAIKTIKTNVLGTLNMLGLAKRTGARFLLTSTSEVYGDPLEHPQTEDYWGNVNPIGTRSCYDEGKRLAETLAYDYWRQHGVNVCIARIFNTYGPRMLENDGRVVSNFVRQALCGEALTLYGDGSQTRSFCYVTETIDGLCRLMQSGERGPINIGNPCEFTIKELAEVIREMVGSEVNIIVLPATPDDPNKRQPDITRAKDLLGWEPKIPLDEGLKHMIEDFKKRGIDKQRPSRDTPKNHRLAVPPSPRPAKPHAPGSGSGSGLGPGRAKPAMHTQLSLNKENFG